MSNDETLAQANFIELTADIVSAYIANNAVQVSSLPELIAKVHASVAGLSKSAPAIAEALVPAVNPKRSVFPDYIICLDDGKRFKSMKRHLAGLGMTPAEYRAKWGLTADYPMVAPNYAAARSELALKSGLGRKPTPKAPARAIARRIKKAT